MTKLFRRRTEKEFGYIEDSHGITSMQQELKVEYELKGKTLEFYLVEERTKNKCPCTSTTRRDPASTHSTHHEPCRIMFRTTTRIIGFLPEQKTIGNLKTSIGNLNKTEKKETKTTY